MTRMSPMTPLHAVLALERTGVARHASNDREVRGRLLRTGHAALELPVVSSPISAHQLVQKLVSHWYPRLHGLVLSSYGQCMSPRPPQHIAHRVLITLRACVRA